QELCAAFATVREPADVRAEPLAQVGRLEVLIADRTRVAADPFRRVGDQGRADVVLRAGEDRRSLAHRHAKPIGRDRAPSPHCDREDDQRARDDARQREQAAHIPVIVSEKPPLPDPLPEYWERERRGTQRSGNWTSLTSSSTLTLPLYSLSWGSTARLTFNPGR